MGRTMKAVVKTHDMGFGAEWRTVPIPEVGPRDILVKVEKDVPLEEFDKGFKLAEREDQIKILLTP